MLKNKYFVEDDSISIKKIYLKCLTLKLLEAVQLKIEEINADSKLKNPNSPFYTEFKENMDEVK